ncbi:GNAT family N-acetyltransferase [Cohnella candidum]|uniref:GNAT family N-acetyltransferase n=1 Tax=Cohnella candidum TaxID=2674991 RepID=A0A3G3JW45_9BACL|nr:GNAT family N-acetyltransferase [Cohnella candidum]AYQ72473.1 GNAT family N-acetyltransferase [Cohnella candidum]
MTYEIKQADDSQLSIVHRVMREAFEEYQDRLFPQSGALREEVEDIRKKITDRGGAIIVWQHEEPIGSAQYYFQGDYMYIGRVSVVRSARGRGIGTAIMQNLEQVAMKRNVFETRIGARKSLPNNISYYQNIGFEILEEHEYPEKTDGWFVMKKCLKSNQ